MTLTERIYKIFYCFFPSALFFLARNKNLSYIDNRGKNAGKGKSKKDSPKNSSDKRFNASQKTRKKAPQKVTWDVINNNAQAWNFIKISEYGKNILQKCPASIGGYQLIRQQALAEGILSSGKYNKVFSCVAYDGRNESLMSCMKLTGVNSIKDEWEKLFDIKSKFIVWEHQEWVEYVRENKKDQFEKDWLNYIRGRYGM